MKRRAFVTLMALIAPIAALAARLGLRRDTQWDYDRWQHDLLSTEVAENGQYKILRFRVRSAEDPPDHDFEIESTYTHFVNPVTGAPVIGYDNLYIGNRAMAEYLTEERGFVALGHFPNDKQDSYDHPVPVTIGYCPDDNKWYGWSHRASYGFNLLDMIFEEEFGDDKTPFNRHGSKPIKTWEDAKLSAGRFAQSVS